MVTQTIIKSSIVSTLLIFFVLIVGRVYGESLDISGNASGSNNSININQTDSNSVNQSNSANVENSVNTNSDSGGNSVDNGVGGGSITTGEATTNVNINNQLNNNTVKISCKNCLTPTPTPKPSPTPTRQPGGQAGNPTAAPLGNVGGGGGGDGGHDGEKGAAKSPEVLGLAATSSENSLLQIIPGFPSIQTQPNDFAFEKVLQGSEIKGVVIPRLNIDLPVVPAKIKNGYWEVSETSASHGEGSVNPGEGGNVVVFAHAREGLFLKLRDIKKEDTVYILTKDRWYKYKVSEIVFVYPNDITTVAPTNSEILTLFTCSGFFDDKRLIVKAIPENPL